MRGVAHDRAVGKVEEARPQLRYGGSLGKSCAGRHHGVQERQPQCNSGALQHCSAGNMFLCDEHVFSFTYLDATCFGAATAAPCLRNASLFTIPKTSEDNL